MVNNSNSNISLEDKLCLELCESEVWFEYLKPMLLSRINNVFASKGMAHEKVIENSFRAAEVKDIFDEIERRARIAARDEDHIFEKIVKKLTLRVFPHGRG